MQTRRQRSKQRQGGAKFKSGMTTAKQLRNAVQLAKRKRQLQHIAHSIKMKQSKMVNELANLFSATKVNKPKSPTKKSHKSKSGITKKSHASKSFAASTVNNISNLFSSMKMGSVARPRASRRVSHRNAMIANQHVKEVENRKQRTAASRSMTAYERAELRKQSTIHN
jgi:hypothetical protein